VEVEEDITIDMTQARVLEPLPPDRPYLSVVSAWTPGKSGAGGRKIHYELTVQEPEEFSNRKLVEDLSLDNEYTLGRLQALLVGLGYPIEQIRQTGFKLPKEADVLGLQCTVRVRTDPSEEYGDRSRIRSVRPASAYSAPATF